LSCTGGRERSISADFCSGSRCGADRYQHSTCGDNRA
jgi:hypothetical protein